MGERAGGSRYSHQSATISVVAVCYQWCHTAAMPTISLRLTEEQHEALRKWAHDGERSVQKELIWRLFNQSHYATAVEQAEKRATEEIRAATGRDDLRAEYVTEPVVTAPRPDSDDHFKPDPKPVRK